MFLIVTIKLLDSLLGLRIKKVPGNREREVAIVCDDSMGLVFECRRGKNFHLISDFVGFSLDKSRNFSTN